MIALIQRVSEANVSVDGRRVGTIERGLLALIGIEKGDSSATADRLLERLLTYRVFEDAHGKMNRSVKDCEGGVLLVPQFTLAADTDSGTRPSFSTAAAPAEAEELFNYLVSVAKERHPTIATGRFGAHMRVALVNDGPVTFWLQVPPHGS